MPATRVLIVSHSPLLTTGYGRVTGEIAKALVEAGNEVMVLALGYGGEPHDLRYRLLPWAGVDRPDAIAEALGSQRPGVLLTIGDPWMFAEVSGLARGQSRWIAYFPVDGFPLPANWRAWIKAVDVPVVFCNWTAGVIEREMGMRPRVIFHGVDTRMFTPGDKIAAKKRVGVEGKFVVGCVAVNQQRKNLPALVKAFAAFAKGKDDVMLYLHTQIAGYWDIEELVRRAGVEEKTRATLKLDPRRGVSDEILATIYNAMDVFVLPTMGEGFGLPIIESQACGVPALVTDFSSCSELVPEEQCRLGIKGTLVMAQNFEQAIVDEEEIAGKLERLYGDPRELARLGGVCRRFAMGFEWGDARGAFVELVGSVCGV